MNRAIVFGAIAVAAVFGGVVYFAGDWSKETPAAAPVAAEPAAAATGTAVPGEPLRSTSGLPIDPAARSSAVSRPASSDPRLAALAVSPDNGQIHFITGSDGKVIREIDNDQASPSYKQPLREYMYAGEQVVGLTAYKYLGDRVQITRTMVSYHPDGSVDRYDEKTSFEPWNKAANPR